MPTLNPYETEDRPSQAHFHDQIRADLSEIGHVKHIFGHITKMDDTVLFDQVKVLIRSRFWSKDITLSVSWDNENNNVAYTNSQGRVVKLSHRPYEENLEPTQDAVVTQETFKKLDGAYRKHLTKKTADPFEMEKRWTDLTLRWVIVFLLLLATTNILSAMDLKVLAFVSSMAHLAFTLPYFAWIFSGMYGDKEKVLEVHDTVKSVLVGIVCPSARRGAHIKDYTHPRQTWNRSDRSAKFYDLFETEQDQALFISRLREVAARADVKVVDGLSVSEVSLGVPGLTVEGGVWIRPGMVIANPLVAFRATIGENPAVKDVFYDGKHVYLWSDGAVNPL